MDVEGPVRVPSMQVSVESHQPQLEPWARQAEQEEAALQGMPTCAVLRLDNVLKLLLALAVSR